MRVQYNEVRLYIVDKTRFTTPPPQFIARLWEQRNGPTLIRPQHRGGYIGLADTIPP